jgi:hypothetical protein
MKYLALLFVLLIISCGRPADVPGERSARQKRAEQAEAVMSAGPQIRTYRIDGNEFKLIELPVNDGSDFIDIQRCFVWRDEQFKTAAMSCGQQPEIVLPARSEP